jgi:DNA-binding MarR family transcriptional regulator
MMTPDEPHWKLFHLISGIYVKSRRLAEESLKPLNVTWPQFGALAQLVQEDRITQRELAERLEADTTTTMVLCDSLERKGWLNRVKDPSDRRVNRLVLTDEGRAVFAKAYPIMLSGYQLFTGAISPEKIEVVMPILGELYGRISEHYHMAVRT